MFVREDRSVVTSASDLTTASVCEYAFVRQLDAKLGKGGALTIVDDPLLVRAGALGDVHERGVLERYREQFPGAVVEIERPDVRDREALAAAVARTKAAFEAGAPVVFQATFASDGPSPFIGFADFIVRMPDGAYRVQDTKLARRAKVTALLQLAAYAERIVEMGVRVDDTVELLLGDGTVSAHRLDDILPVYRRRKARLDSIVAQRVAEPALVDWFDERYSYDGHCDYCVSELESHRDLFLVAGLRGTQRDHLLRHGVTTLDRLAALPDDEHVDGITDAGLASLRAQARVQRATETGEAIEVDVFAPREIGLIPQPDEGDLFFDFEGDPLYAEGSEWGIDYLFGVLDREEEFTAFWAHDLRDERQALLDFLDFVRERRRRHPNLHIYHYASYERTHLLSIAARHGVGETDVDDLLRDDVLVDLYPIVRKALRVGTRSYSIKKLEPLYMGGEHRDDEGVTNAADSIDQYVRYRDAVAAGDDATAAVLLEQIADYNRYDVVSTLRLRDWLLGLGARHGVAPGSFADPDVERLAGYEPSPLADALDVLAGEPFRDRSADETAYALAAAAIDFHRRENKAFWWEHYSRLVEPLDDWADTRDVLRVTRAEVVRDWHQTERSRNERRHIRLSGDWAAGSSAPSEPFAVYEYPGPFTVAHARPGSRPYLSVRVLEADDEGTVLVEEVCPTGYRPWSAVPSALTPPAPPRAQKLVTAIEAWGEKLVTTAPGFPADPVVDLLRRQPPRTGSGALAPLSGPDGAVDAVVASVLDLVASYLAVQGPPGTGKTYVASHVITRLVAEHHWRIGVVAQSHAVVEHVLEKVVDAGLDPDLVGKVPRGEAPGYTALPKDGHALFAVQRRDSGYVIGGTAWDFTNPMRIKPDSLDLLVIDEAGQYSLANTIAVSIAARNLLLLGDPQQLPQVSQGIHPAPVDGSALGFVSAGHDVLPPELGYFIAESRRMDAAVTAPVSRLSYAGELRSHECTRARRLDGVEAGLHPLPVEHSGNATESIEEAAVVVGLVRDLLATPWTDPDSRRDGDPLRQSDFIVVTPYNAQAALVREALDLEGFVDVPVGTVDKFQGREAVVSITTLAASSASEVPRGMSFLIMRNRLNVAISRAQWAAYLVYSPGLEEHLPVRPEGVAELSAFLTLVDGG